MKLLLTLAPYTRGEEDLVRTQVQEYLRSLLSREDITVTYPRGVRGRRLLVELPSTGPTQALRILEKLHSAVPHISRGLLIVEEVSGPEWRILLTPLLTALREVVRDLGLGSFRVTVRRVFKGVPETSYDIAREVGAVIVEELRLPVDLENPRYVVYLEVREDQSFCGLTLGHLFTRRVRALPKNFFSNITVVLEEPALVAEVMDVLRVCAACGLRLVLVGGERVAKLLEQVRKYMTSAYERTEVRLCSSIEEAVKDTDLVIALSRYGRENEVDLMEVLSHCRGKRITFLLGNEYRGLSVRARNLAHHVIRLGPERGFSLRSSTALTYVLGIVAAVRLQEKVTTPEEVSLGEE